MKKQDPVCPHCGKNIVPAGGYPVYFIISLLLLAASLFFWRQSQNAVPGAPLAPRPLISGEKLAYILSPAAAGSCGPCLAGADEFLARKRLAALKARTGSMVLVPGGEYQIGSPDGLGDPDEHPRHAVRLSAFYMDARETTIADYMKFVKDAGANYPEWGKPGGKFNIQTGAYPHYRRVSGLIDSCPSCPVIGVTAQDAAAYCARAGKRLPTEAEWEAAARAGSGTAFSFGDSAAAMDAYAWYEDNSGGLPHPVGSKKPNAFGLYDMHGNVWEWTSDFYEKKYYAQSPEVSPAGPETGRENSLRGGSWAFDADSLRSGNRASSAKANDDIGFRCAAGKAEIERLAEEDVSGPLR